MRAAPTTRRSPRARKCASKADLDARMRWQRSGLALPGPLLGGRPQPGYASSYSSPSGGTDRWDSHLPPNSDFLRRGEWPLSRCSVDDGRTALVAHHGPRERSTLYPGLGGPWSAAVPYQFKAWSMWRRTRLPGSRATASSFPSRHPVRPAGAVENRNTTELYTTGAPGGTLAAQNRLNQ